MRVHSLGHVVLKVRNLERSVPFYRDVLGLKQVGQHGEKMVFFSIVDNHHDLALLETDNLAVSSWRSRQVYTTLLLKSGIAFRNCKRPKIG